MPQLELFLYLFESQSALAEQFKALNPSKRKALFKAAAEEVSNAIAMGQVDRLKRLKNLGYAIFAVDPSFYDPFNDGKASLLLLACQHNQPEVVQYLFNMPYIRRIEATDGDGHTAFYYAMRSNNVALLQLLIRKWPYSASIVGDDGLKVIFTVLNEAYQALKPALSPEMLALVQCELQFNQLQQAIFELRNHITAVKTEDALAFIHARIAFVLKLIQLLQSYPGGVISSFDESHRNDLAIYKLLAENIRFLKRQLKATYTSLPWEALEFYLARVIPYASQKERLETLLYRRRKMSETLEKMEKDYPQTERKTLPEAKQKEVRERIADLQTWIAMAEAEIRDIVLNNIKPAQELLTKTVSGEFNKNLQSFAASLNEVRKDLPRAAFSSLPKGKMQIPAGYETFYADIEKERDPYSLARINQYLKLAVSANPHTFKGRLILQRALQVMGEYVKRSFESPHLSIALQTTLLGRGLELEKMADLRDRLSHVFSLVARNEVENAGAEVIFSEIRDELKVVQQLVQESLDAPNAVAPHGVAQIQMPSIVALRDRLRKERFLTEKEQQKAQKSLRDSESILEAPEKLIKHFKGVELFATQEAFLQAVDLVITKPNDNQWFKRQFNGIAAAQLEEKLKFLQSLHESIAGKREALLKMLKNGSVVGFGLDQLNNNLSALKVKGEDVAYWVRLHEYLAGKAAPPAGRLGFKSRIQYLLTQLRKLMVDEIEGFGAVLTSYRGNPDPYADSAIKIKCRVKYDASFALQAAAEYLIFELRDLMQVLSVGDLIGSPILRNYFAHGDALDDAMADFDASSLLLEDVIALLLAGDELVQAIHLSEIVANHFDLAEFSKVFTALDRPDADILDILNCLPKEHLTLLKNVVNSKYGAVFFVPLIQRKLMALRGPLWAELPPAMVEVVDYTAYYDLNFAGQTLENQTAIGNYRYWLQQRDLAHLARINYNYGLPEAETRFEIIGTIAQLETQLADYVNNALEVRPMTLIINQGLGHWVALVVYKANGVLRVCYRDSLNGEMPRDIRQALINNHIAAAEITTLKGCQQADSYNCGLFALQNARYLTEMVLGRMTLAALEPIFNTVVAPEDLNARRDTYALQLQTDAQVNAHAAEAEAAAGNPDMAGVPYAAGAGAAAHAMVPGV